MTIAVGDKLPEAKLLECDTSGMNEVSTGEIFSGKKVVLFAVPGAFTGTCTNTHVPGYLAHRDAMMAKGVDEIVVLAVNDAFVMGAWAQSTGGEGKIRYLSDWNASFSKAIGMDVDLSVATLGVRSQRYSMIVEDGVVKAINAGDKPGEAVIAGAETLMEQL